MRTLLSRVILGVAAGLAVYVGFSIWADVGRVGAALARFAWWTAGAGVALAAANYLLRFLRWQYYLRVLGLVVPVGESLLVFLAGFSLTVTPGKLGEAIKAFLLRSSRGIPAARTAPIVIAERLTDLIALLLLAGAGAFTFDVDRRFLVVGAVLVVAAIAAVTVDPVVQPLLRLLARVPGIRRFAPRLAVAHESTAALLRPAPLAVALLLSVTSWALECVAFWLIVGGFPGANLAFDAATFIYAAMTVAGALSFLPGGLGVTEAGMLGLLGRLATGTDRGIATAATFVTRVVTLWFAVAVGVVALALFARRKHIDADLSGTLTGSRAPQA